MQVADIADFAIAVALAAELAVADKLAVLALLPAAVVGYTQGFDYSYFHPLAYRQK